ncbi:Core-2/I-Branching enzyme [Roseateles sp. YR242]|uniref:beta-1,6-N-acetylglucosaminyltransferase n=1 Tax=Roseateles sp. YR242 TaxID=1855305 RepID=UPI0008D78858|nr:beta-1,6-N-acetylglucosaminyltransferase [Roseateles sp. YR242]SEK30791.1 Core-2/I-Branching enzyme [Roseateles sp. YR242]
MKIAYLLLVHNAPDHLRRLVNGLRHPDALLFMHIDKKSRMSDFESLAAEGVRFTPNRIAVHWGDYSQVEAILELMRTAAAAPEPIERFVLLSGVDYPVHSMAYVHDFFERRPRAEFLNLVEMPNAKQGKPESRIAQRVARPGPFRYLERALLKAGLVKEWRDYHQHLEGLQPYGGATWWALTRPCVEHVLNFVDTHQELSHYFSTTVCADETFIHTIVGNSPFLPQVARNVTRNYWLPGKASPETFRMELVKEVMHNRQFPPENYNGPGEILFARKFPNDSTALVDYIDACRDRTGVLALDEAKAA